MHGKYTTGLVLSGSILLLIASPLRVIGQGKEPAETERAPAEPDKPVFEISCQAKNDTSDKGTLTFSYGGITHKTRLPCTGRQRKQGVHFSELIALGSVDLVSALLRFDGHRFILVFPENPKLKRAYQLLQNDWYEDKGGFKERWSLDAANATLLRQSTRLKRCGQREAATVEKLTYHVKRKRFLSDKTVDAVKEPPTHAKKLLPQPASAKEGHLLQSQLRFSRARFSAKKELALLHDGKKNTALRKRKDDVLHADFPLEIPLSALVVTPKTALKADEGFVLHLSNGERYRFSSTEPHPAGTALRLPLEVGLTRCASLQPPVALAEVAFETALDSPQRGKWLAAALKKEHGPKIAALFRYLPIAELSLIANNWQALSVGTQLSALEVMSDFSARSSGVRKFIEKAYKTGRAPVQKKIADLIFWGRIPKLDTLMPQIVLKEPARAKALLKAKPKAAYPLLLEAYAALQNPSADDKRTALRAIKLVARATPVAEKKRAHAALSLSPARKRALALNLCQPDLLASLGPDAYPSPKRDASKRDDFVTLWGFAKNAAGCDLEDTKIDELLITLATTSELWMLREQALIALATRYGEPKKNALSALRQALSDKNPRVRASASRLMARRPTLGQDLETVAKLAVRDPWIMVRSAALESLSGRQKAGPVIVSRVKDRAHAVRAAAISALTRGKHFDDASAAAVNERLATEKEREDVLVAAIEFARQGCEQAAAPLLATWVDRAENASANEKARQVGRLAFMALVSFPGPEGDKARAKFKKNAQQGATSAHLRGAQPLKHLRG